MTKGPRNKEHHWWLLNINLTDLLNVRNCSLSIAQPEYNFSTVNSIQTLRNTASESQTTHFKCETLKSKPPYYDGTNEQAEKFMTFITTCILPYGPHQLHRKYSNSCQVFSNITNVWQVTNYLFEFSGSANQLLRFHTNPLMGEEGGQDVCVSCLIHLAQEGFV
jgi:hypothetical protein